jgi:hypothetical protein
MHLVPVNPVHSVHEFPQDVTVIGVAVTQQTGPPASAAVQSDGSSHCQSTEFATGHAVPAGSHVEGVVEPDGTSQQCWPAAQVTLLPPSTPLKGQYRPLFGYSFGGFSQAASPPPSSPVAPELEPELDAEPELDPELDAEPELDPEELDPDSPDPESGVEPLLELLHAPVPTTAASATAPAPPVSQMNLENVMVDSFARAMLDA